MFGSFLQSLWSLSNHILLGSRSRHCYAIKPHLNEQYFIDRAIAKAVQVLERIDQKYATTDTLMSVRR